MLLMAATADDIQYYFTSPESRLVPAEGKDGHIMFTATSSGSVGFVLLVKE